MSEAKIADVSRFSPVERGADCDAAGAEQEVGGVGGTRGDDAAVQEAGRETRFRTEVDGEHDGGGTESLDVQQPPLRGHHLHSRLHVWGERGGYNQGCTHAARSGRAVPIFLPLSFQG